MLCDSLNIPRCLCLLAHNPSIRYHSKDRWKRPLKASWLYRRSTHAGSSHSSRKELQFSVDYPIARIKKEIVAGRVLLLWNSLLRAQSVSAPRSNGLMGEALSPMSTLSAVRFASKESREGWIRTTAGLFIHRLEGANEFLYWLVETSKSRVCSKRSSIFRGEIKKRIASISPPWPIKLPRSLLNSWSPLVLIN